MKICVDKEFVNTSGELESDEFGEVSSGIFHLNGKWVTMDLDDFDFELDDMYGPVLTLNRRSAEKYAALGYKSIKIPTVSGYYVSFGGQMSLAESKEELKMRCDVEMPA